MYNLVIDLGASSGRLMLINYEHNCIELEEIHRFSTQRFIEDDHEYWSINHFIDEIKKGMSIVGQRDIKIDSIGFDTWGVDFGTIDKEGQLLGHPLSYRDESTLNIMKQVHEIIPENEMYGITGIQPTYFNTIYRLYKSYEENMEMVVLADKLLFLPCLLSYIFSGIKKNEYTIASTGQLIDTNTKNYASKIIKKLGFRQELFPELVAPGTVLGNLKKEIANSCGLDESVKVVAVPGHDTACAVCARPDTQNSAYIILGTWTIVGAELDQPIRSKKAYELGFTNEAGVFSTTRFLKNITGFWVLNQVKEKYEAENGPISFEAITDKASQYNGPEYTINLLSPRFNNPENMYEEVVKDIMERYPIKEVTFEAILYAIFNGMVEVILETISQMMSIGIPIDTLNVLGGGSKNAYLLNLIKEKSGKNVTAGPVEASSIGNGLMQLYALGKVDSLASMRRIVTNS
jgi:rhamnulokinase